MIPLLVTSVESSRDLRHAFGCFATGVALITCTGIADTPVAVTVNSFSSVSLAPPVVSFALGRAARCLPRFLADPRFTVHVLHAHQVAISTAFAKPSSASWSGIAYRSTASGHILLVDFVAAFLCERFQCHEVGDHTVIFGQVSQFAYEPAARPLVYCNSRYGALQLAGPSMMPLDEQQCSDVIAQLAWG